tara:strand:- start:661 stop:2019 length:1359 start_codon:yes stop_codon:yes gene_type:complete
MSEVKVNKISPRTACGTTTLGDSGDSFVIPSGVTITNNGTQTGFGRTGTVDWQTGSIKTATFTASDGEGYFANTTGGAFNMNLPAGSAGAIVSVVDYASTFASNALTVVPNGSDKIGGTAANANLATEGQSVTLLFVDATEGWVTINDSTENIVQNPNLVATGGCVSICGNCKIHTFTGPGTFAVSNISTTAANNTVSYMVIAGGAGAGNNPGAYSGGGGAGGFRELKSPTTPYTASPLDGYPSSPNRVTVSVTSYPITVGGGGSGNANGANSIFSTITSAGGGKGAINDGSIPAPEKPAFAGGSGGGGNFCTTAAGAGNTPPTTPSQGNNGGTGLNTPPAFGSGGGGGAACAGQNGTSSKGGNGGAGIATEISGSSVTRAGGGGGFAVNSGINGGTGGPGGGGDGYGPAGPPGTGPASQGTDNTGGGAGGASPNTTNTGGSGLVIIRYKYQ